MYSDEELDSAVAAGVISAESAAAFRAHVAALKQSPLVDDEHFRLVTGFNDVFVVIAVSLLLVSVERLGSAISPWVGALFVSVAAWGLAEFFTRKRRMALPAIVLLVAFVGGAFFIGFLLLEDHQTGLVVGSTLAALSAWLHWARFHVPITVAAGSAALVGLAASGLLIAVPGATDWLSLFLFVAGLVVFWWALRWDASDIARQTRRTDVAFWLHLLASPLIVHPVFTVVGVFHGQMDALKIFFVLFMYMAIAVVSLAIDRRALMVSALGYVLYAVTALLKQTGVVSLSFALTALVIGSALLLLSAFWRPSRAFVLQWLPRKIQNSLPSPK